ncbi:MAG: recombination mediator RecR [Tissierellia bacterium]|nr:recombination mediator RecR [Tissierellia bacterium]
MKAKVKPIEDLIRKLNRLPGIGAKTAQRLAYHILSMEEKDVEDLSQSILIAKQEVFECSICCNFTDEDPCQICMDPSRDHSIICVVETPKDVEAMERSLSFQGVYHVLHGNISPTRGIGAEDIKIRELLQHIQQSKDPVKEVIMATNPTVEGETTAMYVSQLLDPLDIKVTRIGYGLPVGGDLEFYDEVTISTALENRRPLN